MYWCCHLGDWRPIPCANGGEPVHVWTQKTPKVLIIMGFMYPSLKVEEIAERVSEHEIQMTFGAMHPVDKSPRVILFV